MKTLLGDMPEFKETISTGLGLREEIADIITDNAEAEVDWEDDDLEETVCADLVETFEKAEFKIEDGKVMIDDKQGLAQLIWTHLKTILKDEHTYSITNEKETASQVLKVVEKFVDNNYIPQRELLNAI